MRLSRLFQRSNPMLTFFIGLVLGGLLTCTLTIKFWWCSYDTVQVDRDILNIVQINEHFHARRKFQSVLPSVDPQAGSGNGDCICGSEIESLRQQHCNPSPFSPVIDPSIRPSSSVVSKPTEESFQPLRVLRNVDKSNYSAFLHPATSASNSPSQQSSAQYLSREFTLKHKLLVAVITCENHMKSASAVYDTWGFDVSQVLFFVGDECNTSIPAARGLPLVRLPTIPDNPCNSVTKTFSVLKYLLDNNYTDSYHWFMLAVDDMYLRVERLESLLVKLDSSAMIYLGRAANGREEDNLSLLSNEFYCLGSTGIILSEGLLKKLGVNLEYCFSAVNSEDQWLIHPDVEVGRCISRKVKVQCSQSAESKAYFYKDYDNKPLTTRALERNNVFKDLITFQPVPSSDAMFLLHYHYKQLQFKVAMEKTEYLSWKVKDICSQTVTGLPSGALCEGATKMCDCDDTRCPSAGVVPTVPRAYRSIGIYDYQSWDYFDDKTIYNDRSIESSAWLHAKKDSKRELQQMLSKAVQSASEKYGRHLKFKKVIDGWVRHNPSVGSEFIVDCWFSDAFKRYIRKRVSLVRPLATNYITLRDSGDTEVPINFIVPITHVNERLTEFMNMYEQLVLISMERVRLILSVYGREDIIFVNKILAPYRNKYPNASLTVVEGAGEFSRGRALHLGMSKLFGEDLAFFCDVDMTISKPFLDRCRRNTIRGRRVYFPEFFKLYNLDYIYFNKKRPKSISLKRAHGHWAYYSYGMVCVYKSDYDSVGGMNTNIVGWGEEDVNFFEKVVRKNMEVLRSPDTGLSHRWHEKLCSDSLPSKQYQHCLSSRGENLADRIDLANYIYFKGVQLDSSSQTGTHPQLSLYSNYSESEYP